MCQDCEAILEVSTLHRPGPVSHLSELYFPLLGRNLLFQKLSKNFAYEPFVKDLAKIFCSLIIKHFQLIDNKPDFSNAVLVPIPLAKRRSKWRGFNQAEEIAKLLAVSWNLPILENVLVKIKETPPQAKLGEEERRENVKNAFLVKNKGLIRDKKILLIDDVYLTGSTMQEAAKTVKEAGSRDIVGIAVAGR